MRRSWTVQGEITRSSVAQALERLSAAAAAAGFQLLGPPPIQEPASTTWAGAAAPAQMA